MFDIADVYERCDNTIEDCASTGATLEHAFNHFVDASNQIQVTCQLGGDELPDWVWSEDGYAFRNYMPSCVDPTYCLTDPPVPDYKNVDYAMPGLGTLKYGDGEVVTYTCQNPGEILGW